MFSSKSKTAINTPLLMLRDAPEVVLLCLFGILSHPAFVRGAPDLVNSDCADGPPEGAWVLASYDKGPEPDAVEILTARHLVLLTRVSDTAYTGRISLQLHLREGVVKI